MTVKERMKRRRDRFVVGYPGGRNMVFGKNGIGWTSPDSPTYINMADPLTLPQARREVKKLPSRGGVIFELVPVEEAK